MASSNSSSSRGGGGGEDINEATLLSTNKQLSDIFSLLSLYYTIEHDEYRAIAFKNASLAIDNTPVVVLSGAQAKRDKIKGLGISSQEIIDEYMKTGHVKRLDDFEIKYADIKKITDQFREIYGIGPVTAMKFYNNGYRSLEDLWTLAPLTNAQKLGIIWKYHLQRRIPRSEIDIIDALLQQYLKPLNIIHVIAGSYRREEPDSGDIDVLVVSGTGVNMNMILENIKPLIVGTLAKGHTKFMGILRINDNYWGRRIDIRLIEPSSFAYALLYFTGSQRFNILCRQRAQELGMILNEYGLYENGESLAADNEGDIFSQLRIGYLEPWERVKNIDSLDTY